MILLEPSFVRDKLGMAKEVVTDGGGWYSAAFSFWRVERKITWRVVRGEQRSVIQGSSGSSSSERSETSTTAISRKEDLEQLEKMASVLCLVP